jgi:hypothetical protein
MTRKRAVSVLVSTVAVLVLFPLNVDAKKDVTMHRVTHVGNVILDKPIEVGVDNRGVRVETIMFSGDEALVVVYNRTPRPVKAHLGVALYDEHDDLLAAESDAASFTRTFSDVRAGKQESFKVKFGKFIVNFDGASKYALVFVIEDSLP